MREECHDDQRDDVVGERQAEDDPEDDFQDEAAIATSTTARIPAARPASNGLGETAEEKQGQR